MKTNDVITNDNFANKKWKGVNSEKIQVKTWFADKDLSSWTGKSRSGHDRSQNFAHFLHISGPEMVF